MAFKPAICTQCGGKIEVDDSKEAGICPSCGTAFITEKVITQYVTQNNFAGAIFNVQGGVDTENLYTLARRAVQTNNADDALKYYDMINQRNPNDWESTFYSAWYKNDSSLIKNICIALGMLDSSTVDNKKERYAEIGNVLIKSERLNQNALDELFDFLLAKDDSNHLELVVQLLNGAQVLLLKYIRDYNVTRYILQKDIERKNPVFKDAIECGLGYAIERLSRPDDAQKELEEIIKSCDFIDQDKWLKELYTHLFTHFNLHDSQYRDLKGKIEKIDPSILRLRKLKTLDAIDHNERVKDILKKVLLWTPPALLVFYWWVKGRGIGRTIWYGILIFVYFWIVETIKEKIEK